jgi:hypothetical protein
MLHSERFTVMIAPIERQRLDVLAESQGLRASQVIRSLIHKAWREAGGQRDVLPGEHAQPGETGR